MNGQGLKIELLQLVEREEPADARLTLEERGLLMHALGLARMDAQKLANQMSEIGERHFKERAEQYRLIAFKVSRWGVRDAKRDLAS